MNKKQFLESLRKELNILKESEIDDILLEYEQHLDEQIHAGRSEEEAVANFGDVQELAREILDAYQLKTETRHKAVDRVIKWFVGFDDELLAIIKSLPRGVGFSQKFSLFTIYMILLSVILVALIFISQITGRILGWFGGFGTFINVVFIMFWSMMMLYSILRTISHVWKRRK